VNLRFDRSLATSCHSAAQQARVLTQGWVAREAYCLGCANGSLAPTTQNTRALDFRCESCREPYELKSSKRPFRRQVLDGEYSTLVRAIQSHDNPNLLLLNYDVTTMSVTDLQAIPRHTLSRLAIIPRKPLGPTARRAGWQGCSIDLTGLARSAFVPIIISGVVRGRSNVLDDWRQFDFLGRGSMSSRDWLPDVMSCLRRLPSEVFKLETVYEFERELNVLHPKNTHVRPKIRQQLQILVGQGLLERLTPGVYRKTRRFW
jgi:type II restriction enzyme